MSNQYQPQNTKDALRYLQQLANQYLNAPLTPAIIAYNHQQIQYLRQQVIPVAKNQEHNSQRSQEAQLMAQQLEQWERQRLAGQPGPYKMRHFQLQKPQTIKYQHLRQKSSQPGNYRTQHR
ncbi:hypothetical protein [Bombilactobacillus bombi]|uniref:hypothetical protein n=1 Tax=Bombilactobacillus bombi TaxID=1303590 RepID=UPI0015E59CA8|nr:hypothetical protein [Bombilactobacillus bombi]MBA1434458.1 hypothetical protein [Bombilactobacillus bombi]